MNETAPPGASAGELTYEQASARIEEIIRRLDSGEAGLRETLELVREGRDLVATCAAELEAVGQGLAELRLDDLVARLAAEPAASRTSRAERASPPGQGSEGAAPPGHGGDGAPT